MNQNLKFSKSVPELDDETMNKIKAQDVIIEKLKKAIQKKKDKKKLKKKLKATKE